MAKLEFDFSAPVRDHSIFATNRIAWSNGTAVDLQAKYPNIPNGSVVFASSPGVKNPQIVFDGGLVLQTARANTTRAGEVFGLFVKVADPQPFENIRVEVHFDVLQALEERTLRILRIPVYHPGTGIVWRELAWPWGKTKPFIGGVAAVATAADMSAAVIDEDNDAMAVGTCYIRYAPNAQMGPKEESVAIGPGKFGLPSVLEPFLPMKFFAKVFSSITKNFSTPTNVWEGNPANPYKLELLLQASKAPGQDAPQGIGLKRTADNVFVGPGPYLDPSQFTANLFKNDLSAIQYAGANIVVATIESPPSPGRNLGPARVRILKLVVETS